MNYAEAVALSERITPEELADLLIAEEQPSLAVVKPGSFIEVTCLDEDEVTIYGDHTVVFKAYVGDNVESFRVSTSKDHFVWTREPVEGQQTALDGRRFLSRERSAPEVAKPLRKTREPQYTVLIINNKPFHL